MSETAWCTRPATPADLDLVHDAELDYIREREPEQEAAWLRAADRNRQLWADNLARTTVAELGGAPAGYAMWAVLDGTATVVTLHVRPPHRRHGLGRALLDLVADDVRRAGHSQLALGVHRDNPARHLYESAGFTTSCEDGDYLLYRRELAEP
ncbi:GNAT family N-acetyltransferase [Blastococcus sp. SYSU D00922]